MTAFPTALVAPVTRIIAHIPPLLEHRPAALLRISTNRIQDNISAMDDVLKAYAGVVNDLVCTQFAQEVVIAWRCGCNNMCSGPVGQLHGKDADASRRTMNQDG